MKRSRVIKMKITELFAEKSADLYGKKCPCVAFLGDSVTQGCFEIYRPEPDGIQTIFDQNCAYHTYLKQIFAMLYPKAPMNVINAGISGGTAPNGLERLERDVLRYSPDLTVVCFGLNDFVVVDIDDYCKALRGIFTKLQQSGSEVIFMTPNMMNINVSPHMTDEGFREMAKARAVSENNGDFSAYLEAGKKVAQECGVKICDVYKKWRTLMNNGVDTTELLSNHINHPTRQMNWLFAYSLAETIME